MPNLINTDNAGNTFYNYITPVVKGEPGLPPSSFINDKYTSDLGTSTINFIFPAPGIETKTTGYRVLMSWGASGRYAPSFLYTNNSNGTTTANLLVAPPSAVSTDFFFIVANDYSLCGAVFSSSFVFQHFFYTGWLRETTYTGSTYPRGLIGIVSNTAKRVSLENTTQLATLSTAADSITSPPIVCTAGTDPGDGSETFTDIVIRDAAAPNNPVGKLWNCIDMPATCNVGELWRNTGTYDGDASTSEQDVYLCVMPWGTRKLGMRVWTENVT